MLHCHQKEEGNRDDQSNVAENEGDTDENKPQKSNFLRVSCNCDNDPGRDNGSVLVNIFASHIADNHAGDIWAKLGTASGCQWNPCGHKW